MSRKLAFLVIVLAILGLTVPTLAADPGKGHILVEYWLNNGSGTAITDLTGNALYPDNPTGSEWVDSWLFPAGSAGGSSWQDNYGDRMRGYIYPPQTGDYTFWVAGDDLCELWLSTDDTPENAELIARVTGWTNAVDWDNTTGGSTDVAAMKSQPITLQAGQRYYMETLHKEAGGGDSVGVAWAGPGIGANHILLDGKYCAAYIRDPEPMFMAQDPTPADGALGVTAPLLQWTPGGTAMFHDVYFGTDPNPPLVSPRQLFTVFYYPQGLEPGVTYYWKIDEVELDGTTIHPGFLWSFVSQALTAYYPTPADQTVNVSPTVTLTWQPGQAATMHHLYLSDNLDAVTEGTAEADMGEMEDATYTPTDLVGATTYYWRVDETAPGSDVRTGDVWSFTTSVLVDDFESYTDDEGSRIYESWVDGWTNGTGSVVGNLVAPFAEQTTVHGGIQSMPMDFNNAIAPFYSEAELELPSVQNWILNDMNDLILWVYGGAVAFLDNGDNAYTVSGSGTDIQGTADTFRFVYKSLSGNGSITARVDSIVNTNVWAKAGVMIRETIDAGSKNALMPLTPGNSCSFQWRAVGSSTTTTADWTGTQVTAPYWVRITRTGDMFKGESSPDGKTWTQLGTDTSILMGSNVLIGLAVTSHDVGLTTTAEFSNVTTSGTGAWKVAEIGADPEPANGIANLYFVVEDSAGKTATVINETAVNTPAWTEWKIPLSSLTGVNLEEVQKVYIGVGDRDNPVADGSGRIYIDDIQVVK